MFQQFGSHLLGTAFGDINVCFFNKKKAISVHWYFVYHLLLLKVDSIIDYYLIYKVYFSVSLPFLYYILPSLFNCIVTCLIILQPSATHTSRLLGVNCP